MGATFFMLWMMGLFFLGLCFLLGTLGAFLLRRRRVKRGLPHRGHTVLLVVCLLLTAVNLAPSLGFFTFIRVTNAAHGATDGFVDTGVYVEEGFQDAVFTANGITYRRLEDLSFHWTEEAACPPVFSWDSTDRSLSLLTLLFGPYYNRGNYYSVPNEPGLDLVSDGSWRLYCPEDQMDAATAWYGDPFHYIWQARTAGLGDLTPLDPQPDPDAMAALLELNDRAMAEGHAYLEAAPLEEYPPGPLAGSALGAVLVTLPRESRALDTALTLRSVSRDQAVRRDSLHLCEYQGGLWFSPTATYREDNSYHYLVPVPPEWTPFYPLFG